MPVIRAKEPESRFKKLRWRGSGTHELLEGDVHSEKWKRFRFVQDYLCSGPVICCRFYPTKRNRLLTVSGLRIKEISGPEESKNFISLQIGIASCALRSDGKLVAVGTMEGKILVVEATTRKILRTLKAHSAAVYDLSFSSDNKSLISAGDDSRICHWDIASGACLWTEEYRRGCIRSVIVSPSVNLLNYIFTGCQDGSVLVLSLSNGHLLHEFNAGGSIESLAWLDERNSMAVAVGGTIKILEFNRHGNFSLLLEHEIHHKAITSLRPINGGQVLITCSMDHSLKFLRINDLKVIHTIKFQSAILSCDLNCDETGLIIGGSNGISRLLKLRQARSIDQETVLELPRQRQEKNIPDHPASKKNIPDRIERYLRGFRYAKALDFALFRKKPTLMASTIEALIRREGLINALSGRTAFDWISMMTVATKQMAKSRHQRIFLEFTTTLFLLYEHLIRENTVMKEFLDDFSRSLGVLIKSSKALLDCVGYIEGQGFDL